MRGAVFVTGASRGYGRALAVAFARALAVERGDHVALVLLGRDGAGLEGTAAAVQAAVAAAASGPSAGRAATVCRPLDQGDLGGLDAAWEAAAAAATAATDGRLDYAFLLNNAGTLGEVGALRDLGSLPDLATAVTVNVTATVWLTRLFLRWADGAVASAPAPAAAAAGGEAPLAPARPAGPPRVAVVNVSSLAAVQPFPTMGVYNVIKAARDMLHAVVAAEGGGGGVVTLNWAPGPMDTDMQAALRGCESLDAGTRDFFRNMHATGGYVDAAASADRCARVLLAGRHASGAHVDFYDPEPQ